MLPVLKLFQRILHHITICITVWPLYFTRTNKRPVPLEHCLFYSGEVYKVCEKDIFLTQGFRDAKDAFKMKNANKFGAKPGTKSGTPAVRAGTQGRNPDTSSKGRDQKYPKHHQTNSGAAAIQQSTSGSRRSESSFWMPLINNLLKKSLVPVCEKDCFWHLSPCFNSRQVLWTSCSSALKCYFSLCILNLTLHCRITIYLIIFWSWT